MTTVRMTLTDGSPVEFTACSICEHRSWRQGSENWDLHRVLDGARKRR